MFANHNNHREDQIRDDFTSGAISSPIISARNTVNRKSQILQSCIAQRKNFLLKESKSIMIKRMDAKNVYESTMSERNVSLNKKKKKDKNRENIEKLSSTILNQTPKRAQIALKSQQSGHMFLINNISVINRKKNDSYRNYLIQTVKRLEFGVPAKETAN